MYIIHEACLQSGRYFTYLQIIFYYCPATMPVHQNNRETHLNSDTVELGYLTDNKQYLNIKLK